MPNPNQFCGYVGSKNTYKEEDENFDYTFQQVMFESACADVENMTEKEVAENYAFGGICIRIK